MKITIEDVIPMCQYGNRHIKVEVTEEELEGVLGKMDVMFRKYHNSITREPQPTHFTPEPIFICNETKWKRIQQEHHFYNEDTKVWVKHDYDPNIKGGRP